MTILVFSDTHGSRKVLNAALKRVDAQQLLFLGDGLRDLAGSGCSVPVVSVRGNCDVTETEPEIRLLELAGKKVMVTHGHLFQVKHRLDKLAKAAAASGADVVLFGHTHKAYKGNEYGVWLFNPGSANHNYGGSYGVLTINQDGICFDIY